MVCNSSIFFSTSKYNKGYLSFLLNKYILEKLQDEDIKDNKTQSQKKDTNDQGTK